MDRVTQPLWRGVEEPVLSVAEGTSAVLNLSHAARSSSTTKARQQDLLEYALDGHGYVFSCTVIVPIWLPRMWM
jgi:hypothetical protein